MKERPWKGWELPGMSGATGWRKVGISWDTHAAPTSSILPMQQLAHPALASGGTRCVLGEPGDPRTLHLLQRQVPSRKGNKCCENTAGLSSPALMITRTHTGVQSPLAVCVNPLQPRHPPFATRCG